MKSIEKIFEEGLLKYLQTFSAPLGDRKEYIGASDIGQCPRKTILSKIKGLEEPSVKQALIFTRGHLAEIILENSLELEGFKPKTQVELIHPDYPFIRAHIDMMLEGKGKIGVVEQKSTDDIPDEPYTSWVMQHQAQLGLLQLKYPDKEISGKLFAVNLNKGEYKFYGPFKPNKTIYSIIVEKAKYIWEKIEKGETEDLETEDSFLCASCPFKSDCPEFSGDKVPDTVKSLVEDYKAAQKEEKDIRKAKEFIKQEIISLVGENYVAKFDGNKLTVKETVSERVNSQKLKEDYPEVYREVVTSSAYTYFRVT